MKLTKKITFLVLACLLVLSPICMATNEAGSVDNNKIMPRTNDAQVTQDVEGTTSTKIINTDLYTGSEQVTINDTVEGNAFAFGSNVIVNGTIKGDLFVMGNTITIEDSAVIFGNIFAFGSNVIMKGNVTHDVYVFAQNFELSNSGYISRDLRAYAGEVNLDGAIKRDAHITSNSIIIPDDSKNIIAGNLNYTSDNEFVFPEGAIAGEVIRTEPKTHTPTAGEIISSYITRFVTTIIYAIVIILLATFLAPKFVEKVHYGLMKKPFVTSGIGILSIVLIPIFSVLLLITGFLSYIGIAAFVIYCLILSVTLAIFSLAIAKYIEKKLKNASKGKFILFAILSAIVLWLVQLIPFIGGYISLFIYVAGLGVFLYAVFTRKDVSELEKKA